MGDEYLVHKSCILKEAGVTLKEIAEQPSPKQVALEKALFDIVNDAKADAEAYAKNSVVPEGGE